MATLNNYVLGTIQDAVVAAVKTAVEAAVDAGSYDLDYVVSSVDNSWSDMLQQASKGDGRGLVWIHLRSNPVVAQGCQAFYHEPSWRIRVAIPKSGRQEFTDAQNNYYIYAVRKKVVETVGTNRTWSGNAVDSYITDEQEYQGADAPYIGFELTLKACYWYYYT